MRNIDTHAESRRNWLRTLQGLPPTETPPAQSDFEDSVVWKIGTGLACIVIALNLLPPEPSTAASPPTHSPTV